MRGLVLEGGGARGAFHIGAIKALTEEKITFDGISGTSIGALNGAIIAQGNFEALEKFWQELDFATIFNLDPKHIQELISYKFNVESLAYFTSKAKNILDQKGIDTVKIKELIAQYVDEPTLRASGKIFGFVTVEFPSMTPYKLYLKDIPEGKLCEYLMASANLPIFKNDPIDNKHFIDGGFNDNLPIGMLVDKDIHEIFAVRTTTHGMPKKINNPNVSVTYIEPSEYLGPIMNFENETILKNISLGYFDTKKVLLNLSGRKYYIEKDITDEEAFNIFSSLPKSSVLKMAREFKMVHIPYKRCLFEKIIPLICSILKINNTANYAEVLTLFAEHLAGLYEIERFSLYKTSSLLKLIMQTAENPPQKKSILFPTVDNALYHLIKALDKNHF